MPTQLTVFNAALGLLGQPMVETVDDTGEDALVLRGHWEPVALRCHEATAWDHAKLRDELARLEATPTHGYDYYYALPSDLLRLLWISETGAVGDELLGYSVEVGKVATSAETVFISYVSETSVSSVGRWSETFAHWVATELAFMAAPKLAPGRLDEIKVERKKAKSEAIGLDATQGPPQRRRHGAWSSAARGNYLNPSREQS